jgi:Outer membrane lipoprotein-sorting protein
MKGRLAGKIFFGMLVALAWAPVTGMVAATSPKPGLEQPPPIDPAEGRRQARALIDNLLRLQPTESMTQNLLFKITDGNDQEMQVPVNFQVVCTPTNFSSIYETAEAAHSAAGMKLTVTHTAGQPNQYSVSKPPSAPVRSLAQDELTMPFAGSDFWVADLGLDFLHWPEQRVTKKQMRKSVFCDVLESINPQPVPGGYSKIVSWIGANRPEEIVIVHADAFDAKGKLLKQFDPRKLERVNGSYQLEEMEIRNRQAGTNTKVEFQLN